MGLPGVYLNWLVLLTCSSLTRPLRIMLNVPIDWLIDVISAGSFAGSLPDWDLWLHLHPLPRGQGGCGQISLPGPHCYHCQHGMWVKITVVCISFIYKIFVLEIFMQQYFRWYQMRAKYSLYIDLILPVNNFHIKYFCHYAWEETL